MTNGSELVLMVVRTGTDKKEATMKQNNKRRAMILLWGCIAVIALCIAGALAVLLPLPKPETLEIPGQRGTIPATIQMPGKLSRSDETPLVVLCHGFTGNRGGDTHFTQLAQDLAEQGVASVRMDFAGCGESAEPDTAYTLGKMTQDVDSIIAYMQQTYGLDGPIALVGHSMGGRLASLYPQQGSYPVDALVLWSPANGTGLQGLEFLNIDDFSQVEAMAAEALANGKVSAPKWNTEISDVFVQEMQNSDPNAALREAGLPVLLTYAGHETLFTEQTVAETIATVESLPDSQVVLDPFVDGDHNYFGPSGKEDPQTPVMDQALREATETFLRDTLS